MSRIIEQSGQGGYLGRSVWDVMNSYPALPLSVGGEEAMNDKKLFQSSGTVRFKPRAL